MALTTAQIIKMQCLNLYSDPNLNDWILLAQQQTSSCFFGRNYALATALRACHMYTLATTRLGGASGVVSSKREGDLSISYAKSKSTGNANLDQTHYGIQLKELAKSINGSVSILGATRTLPCNN